MNVKICNGQKPGCCINVRYGNYAEFNCSICGTCLSNEEQEDLKSSIYRKRIPGL